MLIIRNLYLGSILPKTLHIYIYLKFAVALIQIYQCVNRGVPTNNVLHIFKTISKVKYEIGNI